MLAQKKPSKKKNMIMSIILVVCVFGVAIMLLSNQSSDVGSDLFDFEANNQSLQDRKVGKINEVIKLLDFNFVDYDIYKKMQDSQIDLNIDRQAIGNNRPFNNINFGAKE